MSSSLNEFQNDSGPIYLMGLSERDERALKMSDAKFGVITWEQLCKITNNVVTQEECLQRRPSELRRYLEYIYCIRMRYGSVRNFMFCERLRWGRNIAPMGTTFAERSDWNILWNDWPYGVENNIAHLVVWTKFSLNQDPVTSELTPETRDMVNQFVDDKFGKIFGQENVSILKFIKKI